jgi:hypothetical protein
MALVPTPARLKRGCVANGIPRVFNPLTGWHCNLRPNTEGTVSVTEAGDPVAGVPACYDAATLGGSVGMTLVESLVLIIVLSLPRCLPFPSTYVRP